MEELDWDGGAGLRMDELEWGWEELVWAGGAGLGKAKERLEVWGQWEEWQGVPTGARLGARTFSSLG